MSIRTLLTTSRATTGFAALAVLLLTTPSFAQVVDPATGNASLEQQIDCDDPTNAAEDICLGLPLDGVDITNFVPLIAPFAAILGAAALAGGNSDGTTATTSTTN